jgi:peroxiredoxin
VLRTPLIARLTSGGIIASTILSLALGAASVGGVSHALLGADPEPFASARPADGEWAWVDELQNADEATRERLKRCASSATSNFASLHRLVFDYDLETEVADVDRSGRTGKVLETRYRGSVSWKDRSVRYDLDGLFPQLQNIGPNGLEFRFKRPKVYSVLRSRDVLAYTEENEVQGLYLTVVEPPGSAGDWERRGGAPLRRLDPWLHYAEPFCQDRATLRKFWENCRAIESEEEGGTVLLRFIRADNSGRVEITCDRSSDWLPVRLRAGETRDDRWIVYLDQANEWRKVSGVWYPGHRVKTAFFGRDRRPVKEFDLTVRNLRANGAVKLSDSAFTPSAMTVPDGTPGLDRRQDPPRGVIRAGGVVREQRPGEAPRPRTLEDIAREWQSGKVPEDRTSGDRREAAKPGSTDPARPRVPNHEYLSLLGEYEPEHRTRERAYLAAKAEPERREAYLALGRLDWTYAPRFLEIGRKYPRDPAAIDALGWLVASNFTPPESEQAADLLIRDHLADDGLMAIYNQLVATLNPAPGSAAERLLRAAAEKAPTDAARGLACLKLADLLRYQADAVRQARGPEPDPFLKLDALARSGGREPVDRAEEDPVALSREAERFYDRVVERYAGIPGKSGTLGEEAAKALFQLREAAVDKAAREVEGPDVDGSPLRLGDYRGKVVVLTFSAHWSASCRAMYPHHRALVERMKGRSFALVSVDIADDKEALRTSIASGEITWRCLWEGGVRRPNCERWHVRFIPSVYVIDADGIIRDRDVKGKALDEAVDALMAKRDRPAAAGARPNP